MIRHESVKGSFTHKTSSTIRAYLGKTSHLALDLAPHGGSTPAHRKHVSDITNKCMVTECAKSQGPEQVLRRGSESRFHL